MNSLQVYPKLSLHDMITGSRTSQVFYIPDEEEPTVNESFDSDFTKEIIENPIVEKTDRHHPRLPYRLEQQFSNLYAIIKTVYYIEKQYNNNLISASDRDEIFSSYYEHFNNIIEVLEWNANDINEFCELVKLKYNSGLYSLLHPKLVNNHEENFEVLNQETRHKIDQNKLEKLKEYATRTNV